MEGVCMDWGDQVTRSLLGTRTRLLGVNQPRRSKTRRGPKTMVIMMVVHSVNLSKAERDMVSEAGG